METLKQKTARGLFWGGMNTMVQQVIGLLFGIILGRPAGTLRLWHDGHHQRVLARGRGPAGQRVQGGAGQREGHRAALLPPPPARARGWRGAIRGFFYPFIFAWHCSQFDME